MIKKIVSLVLCGALVFPGLGFARADGGNAFSNISMDPVAVTADCVVKVAEEITALGTDFGSTFGPASEAVSRADLARHALSLDARYKRISGQLGALEEYLAHSDLRSTYPNAHETFSEACRVMKQNLQKLTPEKALKIWEAGFTYRDVSVLRENVSEVMNKLKVRALLTESVYFNRMPKNDILAKSTRDLIFQLRKMSPKIRAMAADWQFVAPLTIPGLDGLLIAAAENAAALNEFKATLENMGIPKKGFHIFLKNVPEEIQKLPGFKAVRENWAYVDNLLLSQDIQIGVTFKTIKKSGVRVLREAVADGTLTQEQFARWVVNNSAPGAGYLPESAGAGSKFISDGSDGVKAKGGGSGGKAGGAVITGVILFIIAADVYHNIKSAGQKGGEFSSSLAAEYLSEHELREELIKEYQANPVEALVFYNLSGRTDALNILDELMAREDGVLPELTAEQYLAFDSRVSNMQYFADNPEKVQEAWELLQIAFELKQYAEDMENIENTPQFDPETEMSVPFGVKRG